MKNVFVYLTSVGFDKCYLHYDIELNEYFIFVNTKKYNRRMKTIMKMAKKQIYKEGNISKDIKLIFNVVKASYNLGEVQ